MEIISWALNRELSSLSTKHPVPSSAHLQTGTEGGLSLGQCPFPSLRSGPKGGGSLMYLRCDLYPFFPTIPFRSPQVLALAEGPAQAGLRNLVPRREMRLSIRAGLCAGPSCM
ncbi:hypothetical protein LEMLEM_LOCUS13399 [Lemmus lemmus]